MLALARLEAGAGRRAGDLYACYGFLLFGHDGREINSHLQYIERAGYAFGLDEETVGLDAEQSEVALARARDDVQWGSLEDIFDNEHGLVGGPPMSVKGCTFEVAIQPLIAAHRSHLSPSQQDVS
jgi:hypothetical protein